MSTPPAQTTLLVQMHVRLPIGTTPEMAAERVRAMLSPTLFWPQLVLDGLQVAVAPE